MADICNRFYSADGTTYLFGDGHIYKGVTYENNINPEIDLIVGSVASAKLTFSTDYFNSASIGTSFLYQKSFDSGETWKDIGIFNIVEAKKTANNTYSITAYDNIYKLEKDVRSYIFPSSLDPDNPPYYYVWQFFETLCDWCDVDCESIRYVINYKNRDHSFAPAKIFGGNVIKARSLLEYIAAFLGCFAVADSSGIIKLKYMGLGSASPTLDFHKYSKIFYADYDAPTIYTVKVANAEAANDMGIVVTTQGHENENALQIPYNAIFYNDDIQVMNVFAKNILDKVTTYNYRPCQVSLFEDFDVEVGDKIYIQLPEDDTESFSSYVFSKVMDNTGVYFESTGNYQRAMADDGNNEQIQQMAGLVHELNVDVRGIESHVMNLQTDMDKTLTWRAADGLIVFNNATGNRVSIDGDQIVAGTIKADKIYPRTIDFNQLTNEVQAAIEDRAELPDYIKSTYIDSTRILSPNIDGNNISVRNGYFQIQGQSSSSVQPTTYAHFGLASAVDASGQQNNGGIFRTPGGEAYVFVNGNGIRLQNGNYSIIIDSTGPYVLDNGQRIRMGQARFS